MRPINKKKSLLRSFRVHPPAAGVRLLPGVSAGIFILLAAVLALAGCIIVHAPHRTPIDKKPGEPIITSLNLLQCKKHRRLVKKSSIEKHVEKVIIDQKTKDVEFTVAAIEFDDQGQFWSRDQYHQVIDDIKDKYAKNEALQVLVFVTGWKHSAAICDEYLSCFRTMLAYFAAFENKNRPVYGVYVGWRGDSLNVPILKNVTYWARKNAAFRIGAGDCIELLATLEALHRKKRGGPSNNNKLTRLTIMGHSMGGAIVFSAIANPLKERLARFVLSGNPEPKGPFFGFGTLAILVNPAIKASLYQGIHRMLSHNPGIFMEGNPFVLVTVASEKDCPNRFFFPIGQSIGTLLQNARGETQQKQIITTIGHYKPFKTHVLSINDKFKPIKPKSTDSEAESSRAQAAKKCSCTSRHAIEIAVANADSTMKRFIKLRNTRKKDAQDFIRSMVKEKNLVQEYKRTKLEKVGDGPAADSPFIVVLADRKVISGHSDIWSLPFMEFVSELIARNDEQIKSNDQDNKKERIY